MKLTRTLTIVLFAGLAYQGCADSGSRHDFRKQHNTNFNPSGTVSQLASGSSATGTGANGPNGTGTPGTNGGGLPTAPGAIAITGIVPAQGPAIGGTDVTISGQAFNANAEVKFGGFLATAVQVNANGTSVTCKTPAHAPGLVDVEVVNPSGAAARLNNAFTYDLSGALARVADYGNPTAQEQELLELTNRARRDPVAEAARLNATHGLNLDFSGYVARPPLSMNGFLTQTAGRHSEDMAARAFYGHVNPDGVGPNGRVLDTAYDLHRVFGTDRSVNRTENVGAGSGNLFNTPQKVHDTFMIDEGLNPAKHRELMLGVGNFGRNREVGFGFRINLPSAGNFNHFTTEEFAVTNRDRPFIVGTVFNDGNGDGIAQAGEGQANVTVTLSHASGFTLTTQSKSAGGYAFEVFVDEPFTITINGQSATVTINGDNVKVDSVSGAIQAR